MITVRGLLAVGALLGSLCGTPQEAAAPTPAPRFQVLDVLLDTGTTPLAAWQLEVTIEGARLVGIEGGEPTAFREPPRYDPSALQGERVVLAALASGDSLPRGKLRVARLHLTAGASPEPLEPKVRNTVAADPRGRRFDARLEVRSTGEGR